MGDRTKIEWTDATWNPVRGCTRVSAGCGGPGDRGGCYAEQIAARFSDPGQPFHGFAERTAKGGRWTGKVALIEEKLTDPLRWRKPRRVFVNSMSDLFHEALDDAAIDRVFAVMALASQHTFQVLTKRPERMLDYIAAHHPPRRDPVETLAFDWLATNAGRDAAEEWYRACPPWPLPNVWLGVSVEDQETVVERIPMLLQTPAAVRFVSYGPALGPVDFRQWLFDYGCGCGWGGQPFDYCNGCGWRGIAHGEIGEAVCPDCDELLVDYNACPNCDGHDGDGMSFGPNSAFLHGVICEGESGPKARPMHPDWARSARDQCAAAGVPFFFKQWGEWTPGENVDRMRGIVGTAYWFNGWHLGSENLANEGAHYDDQPDVYRIGKKHAGRLLDGREHNDLPRAR